MRNKILGPDHPDARGSTEAFVAWKDEHDLFLNKQLSCPSSQLEKSEHLQDVPQDKPAAIMAHPHHQGHDHWPHAPRRLATGLLLRDHPLIIASKASSYTPGGQDSHEVD
jgi:hypothetical protein